MKKLLKLALSNAAREKEKKRKNDKTTRHITNIVVI